jgi:hypothetical protein
VAQHEIIGGAGRNNVINVTEWCKKKACWDSVKAVQYTLSISFAKLLLEVEEIRAEARDAQREQREISEAEIFIAVVQAGADYWKNVRAWACNGQNAKPSDLRLLDVAAEIPRRMPTEKQSLRLFELKSQYDGSPD